MRNPFYRHELGPEQETKKLWQVGDLVKHPFRPDNVPIIALADNVIMFTPKHGAKEVFWAVEGSAKDKFYSQNEYYFREIIRNQPSAEIDLSNDNLQNNLVIPISKLQNPDLKIEQRKKMVNETQDAAELCQIIKNNIGTIKTESRNYSPKELTSMIEAVISGQKSLAVLPDIYGIPEQLRKLLEKEGLDV